MKTTPLTVAELAAAIAEWPDQSAATVWVTGAYPELSQPVQAHYIGVNDHHHNLVLVPEIKELPEPAGSSSALDLALEAMRYQLLTPFLQYDPDVANSLFLRAVTAIESVQKLQAGLGL